MTVAHVPIEKAVGPPRRIQASGKGLGISVAKKLIAHRIHKPTEIVVLSELSNSWRLLDRVEPVVSGRDNHKKRNNQVTVNSLLRPWLFLISNRFIYAR